MIIRDQAIARGASTLIIDPRHTVTKRKDHLDSLIAEAGQLCEQIEDRMEE